jgi:hypothetical protein
MKRHVLELVIEQATVETVHEPVIVQHRTRKRERKAWAYLVIEYRMGCTNWYYDNTQEPVLGNAFHHIGTDDDGGLDAAPVHAATRQLAREVVVTGENSSSAGCNAGA